MPVCRIATVRANGEPHVIPVCPVFDGDATVYVDLDPRSASAAALRSTPKVAVLIDDYHDDWSQLRKVLLRCTADPASGVSIGQRVRVEWEDYEGLSLPLFRPVEA